MVHGPWTLIQDPRCTVQARPWRDPCSILIRPWLALGCFAQSQQGDTWLVQDDNVELGLAVLSKAVVGLAVVEASVLEVNGGDDMAEGGGNVASLPRPLEGVQRLGGYSKICLPAEFNDEHFLLAYVIEHLGFFDATLDA